MNDSHLTSVLLRNARIVLPERTVESAGILINEGRIAQITSGPNDLRAADSVIDLTGLTLFPGFIDVHIHGAVGVDTMAASGDDLARVSTFLASQGVTGWLPTLVPASDYQYESAVTAIDTTIQDQVNQARGCWDRGRPARLTPAEDSLSDQLQVSATERAGRPRSQSRSQCSGARVLGVHYEGPFVNEAQCGALHREHFRTYTAAKELDKLPLPAGDKAVRMITVAPEIEGGVELVRELKRRGWIVSIGHTRATPEVLDSAHDAGARHMTHFMNAMAPLHHRAPGPIAWGLAHDDVTCDVIADGIHLDTFMLRLLLKLKTPEGISLISDAIAAAGMGNGDYEIWGETISVKNGRTQNAHGSIAGSVITMLDAIRMMLSLDASESDVERMASTNPARLLGIEADCGSIEEGKRADLVALDSDGNVQLTLVGGVVAHTAPKSEPPAVAGG